VGKLTWTRTDDGSLEYNDNTFGLHEWEIRVGTCTVGQERIVGRFWRVSDASEEWVRVLWRWGEAGMRQCGYNEGMLHELGSMNIFVSYNRRVYATVCIAGDASGLYLFL